MLAGKSVFFLEIMNFSHWTMFLGEVEIVCFSNYTGREFMRPPLFR